MARRKVKIESEYAPRKWQAYFHANKKRSSCLVIHRRGGKTVGVIEDLKDEALKFNKSDPLTGKPLKNPKYAYLATTRGQAEEVAWEIFKDSFKNIPGINFNNSKLKITFPHPRGMCTILLLGTENFNPIRGNYLDGVILDEFGDMHPSVRDEVVGPMLADRKGWEIIIGTPKGDNDFKKVYENAKGNPDWFCLMLKASESNIIDPEELQKRQENMSETAYLQEFECDFNAVPEGYYYQKIMEELRANGQICSVPHSEEAGVMTFWDLGMNDSGVIWFIQEVGREVHVIDYLEASGKGLDWYVSEVLNERAHYQYIGHWLPHDVEVRELTNGGRSRKEYLENLGLGRVEVVPKTQNVQEDIHATRSILKRCMFDKEKCAGGIMALKHYQRKWDKENRVFMNKPLHNWASHGADGFRQFAVTYEPGIGKMFESGFAGLSDEADHDFDVLKM